LPKTDTLTALEQRWGGMMRHHYKRIAKLHVDMLLGLASEATAE